MKFRQFFFIIQVFILSHVVQAGGSTISVDHRPTMECENNDGHRILLKQGKVKDIISVGLAPDAVTQLVQKDIIIEGYAPRQDFLNVLLSISPSSEKMITNNYVYGLNLIKDLQGSRDAKGSLSVSKLSESEILVKAELILQKLSICTRREMNIFYGVEVCVENQEVMPSEVLESQSFIVSIDNCKVI